MKPVPDYDTAFWTSLFPLVFWILVLILQYFGWPGVIFFTWVIYFLTQK